MMTRLVPAPLFARPWRTTGRLTLALCALLACSVSCSKRSGSGAAKKKTIASTPKSGSDSGSANPDVTAALADQVAAVLRFQRMDSFDRHVKMYLNLKADEKTRMEQTPSLAVTLKGLLGGRAASALRKEGNVELIVFADPDPFGLAEKDAKAKQPARPRWAAIVPVTSAEEFFRKAEAKTSPEHSAELVRWTTADNRARYVRVDPLKLSKVQSTDQGARVVVSDHPDGALVAEALLRKHLKKVQDQEFRFKVWPTRLGMNQRYGLMGADMRHRLGRSGHNLLPARANFANFQVNLYTLAGHAHNWPEPMELEGNFKMRQNKVKELRLFGFIPTKGLKRLEVLHEALKPDQKAGAPPLAPGALARVSLRLNRDRITEVSRTMLPRPWRMMLTARGEDKMTALSGTFDELLDHNRGATTVGFYPQNKAPLSPEVLVAWETMDVERLPKTANLFHKTLMTEFWMPLFLADPTKVKERPFSARDGKLKGFSTTFTMPGSDKVLGVCWGVEDLYYYAYYGEDPCAQLPKLIKRSEDGGPPPMVLDADMKSLADMLYAPPARSLKGGFDGGRLKAQFYARDEGKLEVVMFSKNPAHLRGLTRRIDDLAGVWSPGSKLDLSDIITRAGLEQSIYQEPGIMIVGPPGLLGALPPSYYLGLPFSLPPAPPHQLRAAIRGDDPAEKPARGKTDKKKRDSAPKKK